MGQAGAGERSRGRSRGERRGETRSGRKVQMKEKHRGAQGLSRFVSFPLTTEHPWFPSFIPFMLATLSTLSPSGQLFSFAPFNGNISGNSCWTHNLS